MPNQHIESATAAITTFKRHIRAAREIVEAVRKYTDVDLPDPYSGEIAKELDALAQSVREQTPRLEAAAHAIASSVKIVREAQK